MSLTSLAGLVATHGASWALGSLLKGTVLLLAVFLLAAALRRASAGLRHLVWSGGIAAVLLLPVVTLVVPWRLPVARVPAVATAFTPPLAVPSAAGAPAERPSTRLGVTAGPSLGGSAPDADLTGRAVVGRSWTLSSAAVLRWMVWVWAAGVLVVLLRFLRGVVLVARVRRRAEPLAGPGWTQPLVEAADRLGLEREPRLLVSDDVLMPILCGFLDPAIVLPGDARTWTDERRRAVLSHELAHVRRADLAVTVLSRLGCALYWFHPLFWAAARRLRLESERACDDLVLAIGTRPSEYADHLLQIACHAGHAHTPLAALPMAERREFEGRMLAILEKDARRAPPSTRLAALFAIVALAVVIPLAAMGMAQVPAAGHQPADGSLPGARPAKERVAAQVSTRQETRAAYARVTDTAELTTKRLERSETDGAVAPPPRPATEREPVTGDSIDPRTLAALVSTLDDPEAPVRLDAAYALGRLQAGGAVAALTARLRRDPAPTVREMVAWALGQIEDRTATAPLAGAADHDASEAVRVMAVWALGQLEDPAALPGLVAALADASGEVRGRAAWAIGTLGPDRAPPALIAALRDAEPDVRTRAAWALGRIEDAQAATALSAALGDASPETRRAVVWALGRMDAPEARQALLGALTNADPEVRARAARALAGSGGDPWPWPWPMPIIR